MSEREREQPDPKGYGNIYTPHAGSMIIAVQREGGLASRTIVLSERKVKLLRLLMSKSGLAILGLVIASWIFFGAEAARVPALQKELTRRERDAARLDTLEYTLTQLQKRYEQVQHMLGASGPVAVTRTEPSAPTRPPTNVERNRTPPTIVAPMDSARTGQTPRDSSKPALNRRADSTKIRDTTRVPDSTAARDNTAPNSGRS